MVTNALQVEEIRFMFRQAAAGHFPRFFFREPGFVNAFHNGPHRRRRIFIDVHEPPFLVGRDVPNGRLANFGPGVKDGHPFKHPIGRMVFAAHPHVPHLAPGVDLFDELRDFHVVELGIAPIGLGFHVVPPHVFLPFGEQPRGLIRHRTGLTRQTPVNVEHKCKLPFGMPFLIGIQHLAA